MSRYLTKNHKVQVRRVGNRHKVFHAVTQERLGLVVARQSGGRVTFAPIVYIGDVLQGTWGTRNLPHETTPFGAACAIYDWHETHG